MSSIPSALYIPLQGLETYFVDKDTGAPLSGGSLVFWEDTNRSVPKDVYQQMQGPNNTYTFVNIGNIVPLSSVGTTISPNDGTDIQVYLFPWVGTSAAPGVIQLYFIQVYSSGSILQFTREAQPPDITVSEGIEVFTNSDNQIENSQFVNTFLPLAVAQTYTVTGTNAITSVAPNWDIITTGSGTITITWDNVQDVTEPTGAPYALEITSSGLTAINLRQRFYNSPRLCDNNYVAALMSAKSFGSVAVNLVMNYISDTNYSVNLINAFTTNNDAYSILNNPISPFIASTDSSGGSTGYVDIIIVIPVTAHVAITSVQLATVLDGSSIASYIPNSSLLQKDRLFNYYKDQLLFKPTSSWLVGWDFPLNPAQINGDTVAAQNTGSNSSYYAWDQTILYQSVTSGITTSRDTSGAITLTAAATTQMALIQYLPQKVTRDLLQDYLSFWLEYSYSNTSDNINASISFWYTKSASLPNVATGTNQSIVAALSSSGFPAGFNGTWIQIPRINMPNATFALTTAPSNTFNQISFNSWDLSGNADVNAATYIAVVIGTGTIPSGHSLTILNAALLTGNNPTRPNPKTIDETLRECQYYYERSFAPGLVIGSLTYPYYSDSVVFYQTGTALSASNNTLSQQIFGINYKQTKRAAANLTFYSPYSGASAATSGSVAGLGSFYGSTGPHSQIYVGDITVDSFWSNFMSSTQGFSYNPTPATLLNPAITFTTSGTIIGTVYSSYWLAAHYVADSRLGIVL